LEEPFMPRPDLDDVALWQWIRGITYPVPGEPPGGTDPFLASVQEGLRQRAAEFYARRYHAAHGCLPEGTHQVQVTVDPAGVDAGGDIQDFYYNRSPRHLETAITFPSAAAYQAAREHSGSAL
jgi:hypothetical protein